MIYIYFYLFYVKLNRILEYYRISAIKTNIKMIHRFVYAPNQNDIVLLIKVPIWKIWKHFHQFYIIIRSIISIL